MPPQTKEACRKILSEVDKINPVIALMLEFSALTGLRYSDVSRLKFTDLMVNGVIRDSIVVIQVKAFNKRIAAGIKAAVAKDRSKVTIFINEQCKAVIEDALRLANDDAKKLAFESSIRAGMPYSAQYVNRILKVVAVKLKLNFALSTHSFRKAFALFLINNNARIHQVRDALGQSSLSSTDAYLQTFMSDHEALVSKVGF
jgi:integrase